MSDASVVEAVRSDLLERLGRGLRKYGLPVEQARLPLEDWLQHTYEEALDMAVYLKRAMREIEGSDNG